MVPTTDSEPSWDAGFTRAWSRGWRPFTQVRRAASGAHRPCRFASSQAMTSKTRRGLTHCWRPALLRSDTKCLCSAWSSAVRAPCSRVQYPRVVLPYTAPPTTLSYMGMSRGRFRAMSLLVRVGPSPPILRSTPQSTLVCSRRRISSCVRHRTPRRLLSRPNPGERTHNGGHGRSASSSDHSGAVTSSPPKALAYASLADGLSVPLTRSREFPLT